MRDADCVAFLQWALPRLEMRWPGFRRVRGQVCKRVGRRLRSLGLPDVSAYRSYLEKHPSEWAHLDGLCRITVSRFCRDHRVFAYLAHEILPKLAELATLEKDVEIRAWSIGCGGGEEVYTLTILWHLLLQSRFSDLALRVLGTDADRNQLARAREACYPRGSLKEMPVSWRHAAFEESDRRLCVRDEFRMGVDLQQQDIRHGLPGETFHLILCRNLAFTYFKEELQRNIAAAIRRQLLPRGVLVLGKHESIPPGVAGLAELAPHLRIYRAVPVSLV